MIQTKYKPLSDSLKAEASSLIHRHEGRMTKLVLKDFEEKMPAEENDRVKYCQKVINFYQNAKTS